MMRQYYYESYRTLIFFKEVHKFCSYIEIIYCTCLCFVFSQVIERESEVKTSRGWSPKRFLYFLYKHHNCRMLSIVMPTRLEIKPYLMFSDHSSLCSSCYFSAQSFIQTVKCEKLCINN